MAEQYYKTVIHKHTYGELWRIMRGNPIGILFGFAIKLFRINLPVDNALCMIEKLDRVDADARATETIAGMEKMLDECAAAGLPVEFMYTIPEISHNVSCSAVLASDDARIVNQVMYVRNVTENVVTENCHFACVTFLADGGDLSTSTQPRTTNEQPGSQNEYHPGKSVEFVLKRHRDRVNACRTRTVLIPPEKVESLLVDETNKFIQFCIQRGTMVPMTEDEVDALRGKLGKTSEVSPGQKTV
jgi:hypothetical protein